MPNSPIPSNDELLKLVIESTIGFAIIALSQEGTIAAWNVGAERLLGYTEDEAIGIDGDVIFTLEDRAAGMPQIERSQATLHGRAEDQRWHVRKDGARFWGSGLLTPLPNGMGFVKIMRDETAKRFAEEHLRDSDQLRSLQDSQQILLAELQHRTRNLLALVQAISRRSARTSASFEEFRAEFENRLRALSRAESLVSNTGDGSVEVRTLIEAELSAHLNPAQDANKVHIEGPSAGMPASSAQAVTLALHELATNAVKYGALGQDSGHLTVSWRTAEIDGERRVLLEWQESGVNMPSHSTPRRKGYGSELIERALPYQLNAETKFEFGADGVHCLIAVPIAGAAETRQ